MPLFGKFNEQESLRVWAEQERIKTAIEAAAAPRFAKEFNRVSVEAAQAYKNAELETAIQDHGKRMDKLIVTLFRKTMPISAKYTMDQAGKGLNFVIEKKETLNIFNLVEGWIQTVGLRESALITGTTADLINNTIAEGVEEGLGEAEIARNITKATGGSIGRNRALTVARTETQTAFNQASLLTVENMDLPVEVGKKWVPAGGNRTRDTHREMRDHPEIRMKELFNVGRGRGEYPGDTSLPPEERINCRCILVHPTLDT